MLLCALETGCWVGSPLRRRLNGTWPSWCCSRPLEEAIARCYLNQAPLSAVGVRIASPRATRRLAACALGALGCAIQGEILLDDAAIPLPAEAGTYRLFIATFVGSVETRRAELAVDIRGPRDECGVCGGGGASCMGCDGQINSGAVFDRCGKCAVPGTADFNACVDCSGEVDGVDSEDICGVCGGDGTSCLDCFDTPFGTARPDSCGECGGNDATCIGSYSLEAVLSSKGLCAGDKVAVRG